MAGRALQNWGTAGVIVGCGSWGAMPECNQQLVVI